jgi:peptidoglycan hydrolase CwlO-like protein
VISIQFLNEPFDKKPYDSDAYENFIRRLKVEWSGVALLQVLKTKEQSINDLAELKGNIENEVFLIQGKAVEIFAKVKGLRAKGIEVRIEPEFKYTDADLMGMKVS